MRENGKENAYGRDTTAEGDEFVQQRANDVMRMKKQKSKSKKGNQ